MNQSISESTARLESKIESAIDLVGHARHAGIVRIDSNPRFLDAGFPTDAFMKAERNIDLCGMTLHALFAEGNFTSTIDLAVRRGCSVRICVSAPSNTQVINNCLPSARTAMPGQCQAVIEEQRDLRNSLKSSPELANHLSLSVLEEGTMAAFISRVDSKMLVVPYLRSMFTMESPAMLAEENSDKTIFNSYLKEFDYLLTVSREAI